MKRRRIVEGHWNCNQCGTTKIRAGLKTCPNCGKSQGEDTVFDFDRKNINYVSEEKAAKISRNPDWLCNYCEQLNPDTVTSCKYCGAERTSENLDYFENRRKQEAEEQTRDREIEEEDSEEVFDSYIDSSSSNSRSSNSFLNNGHSFSFKNWLPGLFATLLGVLAIVAVVFLLIPKETTVTVDGFSWERSISIQRYQAVKESDWDLPSGARLLYSQREVYDTVPVIDHYDYEEETITKQRIVGYEDPEPEYIDLGNGYFEEVTGDPIPIYEDYTETVTKEVPVYRYDPIYKTKYYYEIDKWLYERSVETSGNDKKPYFGDTNLASDERESSKSESYTIYVTDEKGKNQSINLSFEDWNSLEIGQTVKIKVSLGHGEIVE